MTFIHVIETLDLPFAELAAFYDRLEKKAVETMSGLADPVRAAGVRIHQRIEYGKRAERGSSSLRRTMTWTRSSSTRTRVRLEDPGSAWATLSYKIAILAQCPVLLVKGPA